MNIVIRADGGPSLGMGHIMRCISLAKMWEHYGNKVFFISRFAEGIHEIESAGFEAIHLQTYTKEKQFNRADLQCEIAELIDIFENQKIDIAIIDHYSVTEFFFLALKPYCKMLCYIDDLNAAPYPVDVVINGNITAHYLNYQPANKEQQFLLGTSYNLIREEFKNIPRRSVKNKVQDILITTGGSDPFDSTTMLIDFIRGETKFNQIRLHVIIGNSFLNKEALRLKQYEYENIIFYENTKKISSIMLESDIAISSSGSTLYELCACGLPTLGFILVDNQAFIAQKMDERGYIKNLGWYYELNKKKLIDSLCELIDNLDVRKQMAGNQQTLVDGKGTERIVSTILNMMREEEGEY